MRGRQRTLRPEPWLRGTWQWGHRSESWSGVFHGYLARRAPTGPNIRPSKNPPPVWRCPAEETPLVTASPSSNMVGPSPGPYPLLAIPVLPSLSVLVGWCRLAGLVHTVPLSLAGYLEGYLTTELLPTGPLLWQPGGSSTPGSVRVFLWLRRSEDRMLRTSGTWQPPRRLWLAASAGVGLATFHSGDRVACCIPGGWRRLAAVLVQDDTGSTDDSDDHLQLVFAGARCRSGRWFLVVCQSLLPTCPPFADPYWAWRRACRHQGQAR